MNVIKKYIYGDRCYFHYTKGNVDVYKDKTVHDFYELYYFINGNVEFINDKERKKLSPNDLLIIRPGEYHHMKVLSNVENYERCVIYIREDFLKDYPLSIILKEKNFLSLSEKERLYQNLQYLKDGIFNLDKKELSFLLSHLITDILFNLKNAKNNFNVPIKKVNELSFSIMQYINENYKNNLTLKLISDKFFTSPSTISHIFKQDFNISVIKYLAQKRITEAHLEILNGKKPQVVSQEFSFENYSTFYRAYKKHFGVSPSITREKR